MLDIRGTLKCRVYNCYPGIYRLYFLASQLGIKPGEVCVSNKKYLDRYRAIKRQNSPWYILLHTKSNRRNKHKKQRRIPTEKEIMKSQYYNEIVAIPEEVIERVRDKWFDITVKSSIILPIIKEGSKIPNSLLYNDEYWKKSTVL